MAEASRIIRPAERGVLPKAEQFYWVFAVDSTGKIKWETQIPMMLFNSFDQTGIVLASTDFGVIFSATNNLSTELMTVSDRGEPKFHVEIPGRFILVRPISAGGPIQLFGRLEDQPKPALVTLDDRLIEVRRIQADYPKNLFANFVFSAPGESLVLFGSTINDVGARYTSRVVSVDRALSAEQNLELPNSRGPLSDIGFIRAAAPGSGAGEFVVARSVFARDFDKLPEAARPKIRRGLALDYLHFE